MELTQLKYFQTVSRLEHFTKAAEELHVSQPSLSKSIANLEDELGTSLFDRDRRNVHLNGYGQALLVHVDRILSEVKEAVTELSDMREGEAGSIRIVSSFLLDTPSRITPFLRDFYFAHPNVRVHVFYQNIPAMTELLRERRADLAFSTGCFSQPDIEERPLFSHRLGLIVGRTHPLAARNSVWLAELAQHPFLSNNSSPDLQDTTYDVCARAGFRPKIAFECDNADLIGEAAARGLGVVLASERRYERNSEERDAARPWKGELTFIPVEDDFCKRTTSVAWLKNRYQTAATRRFLDEMLVHLVSGEDEI